MEDKLKTRDWRQETNYRGENRCQNVKVHSSAVTSGFNNLMLPAQA